MEEERSLLATLFIWARQKWYLLIIFFIAFIIVAILTVGFGIILAAYYFKVKRGKKESVVIKERKISFTHEQILRTVLKILNEDNSFDAVYLIKLFGETTNKEIFGKYLLGEKIDPKYIIELIKTLSNIFITYNKMEEFIYIVTNSQPIFNKYDSEIKNNLTDEHTKLETTHEYIFDTTLIPETMLKKSKLYKNDEKSKKFVFEVSPDLINNVKDTIKEVNEGMVMRTLDRTSLYAVQTPQTFAHDIIEYYQTEQKKGSEKDLRAQARKRDLAP